MLYRLICGGEVGARKWIGVRFWGWLPIPSKYLCPQRVTLLGVVLWAMQASRGKEERWSLCVCSLVRTWCDSILPVRRRRWNIQRMVLPQQLSHLAPGHTNRLRSCGNKGPSPHQVGDAKRSPPPHAGLFNSFWELVDMVTVFFSLNTVSVSHHWKY